MCAQSVAMSYSTVQRSLNTLLPGLPSQRLWNRTVSQSMRNHQGLWRSLVPSVAMAWGMSSSMMAPSVGSHASEYSRPLSPSKGRGKGTIKRSNLGHGGGSNCWSLFLFFIVYHYSLLSCVSEVCVAMWSCWDKVLQDSSAVDGFCHAKIPITSFHF